MTNDPILLHFDDGVYRLRGGGWLRIRGHLEVEIAAPRSATGSPEARERTRREAAALTGRVIRTGMWRLDPREDVAVVQYETWSEEPVAA